jgi:16S rRNA (guanine1207-N2)-methyltransferase
MSDHYFAARPQTASRPATVPLVLPDLSLELATDRGMFSPERVDPGTRLLLLEAPAPDPSVRHILDLGCGYGPIAVAAARRAPDAVVWAVDTNERAVDLCRTNADQAGVGNRVHALVVPTEDPLAGVPTDVRFDLIWSNPPIRVGKARLHVLLASALDQLSSEGTAVLVVHKHLGSDSLHRWLVDQGFDLDRLVSRQGYRLLRVQRPAAARQVAP